MKQQTIPTSPSLPQFITNPGAPDLLGALVEQRLAHVELHPELRQALEAIVQRTAAGGQSRWSWSWLIPALQPIVAAQGAALDIAPFRAAWSLMYTAIVLLDHMQDDDPEQVELPTLDHPSAHYNLLLACYVLATSLLDDVALVQIPARRIIRLHRLWSDMMLRMAGGQHEDVLALYGAPQARSLTAYQQCAQAKTGSTFALAFGGTATLLSDDAALIAVFTTVGDIFGTLIQYHDDLLDAPDQPATALTFPAVFAQWRDPALPHTPQAFWEYVYQMYRADVETLLADVPCAVRQQVLALFTVAFDDASVQATQPQ